MSRPSSIDQMPDEIRSEISRLRIQGVTIDRILEHLRALYGRAPSRSALGRHIKGLDAMAEKARRSRDVASALVREMGDAPESMAARANIELLHSMLLDVQLRASGGEDIDEDGKAAVNGNPMGMMLLAKAMDHLTKASRTNEAFTRELELRTEARVKKEAASRVEAVARERGLSRDIIEEIKAGVFGVKRDRA
ncbi:phage protein Gp27 family protein [Acidisoma sp. 7E03]